MNAGAGVMAAGAAAAAIAQAIKASGVLVQVEPADLLNLLELLEEPLVIEAHTPRVLFIGPRHRYLTTYKGLAFYADSPEPLDLPPHAEVVPSKKLWIPG